VVLNDAVSNDDHVVSLTSPNSRLKQDALNNEYCTTMQVVLEACLRIEEPSDIELEACHAKLNPNFVSNPHVSSTMQQAIVEAYAAGQTITAMAKHFDLHRTTVSRALNNAGITTRTTNLLTDSSSELVRRYYSDHNLTQTAQHFAVGKKALVAFMDRHGIPRRRRYDRPVFNSPRLGTCHEVVRA
jgi:DNA-directed RNA polymerase beta subunit